ncbi:N-formylglutamate amidohydrolase [Oryzifoliimicrobium ureilyticus]|uniref:N-formylglutamate amidohydrolase n=1 Tax=Oryzifoliimicrobium ureilyticus TaxID=3113724 RepID=UPI00307628CC
MTDFSPFEQIEGAPERGLVILGDHAMNRVPSEYGQLGLAETAFQRHIAYDIGIEGLVRGLCARLKVPGVLGCFSRLLIDPNRGEDDPTLIMRISDGAIIPANHPLSEDERNHRIATYYRPYHNAVSTTIKSVAEAGRRAPLVLSMHSFTPFWKDVARPWHAAVLWDSDPRAVVPLLDMMRQDKDLLIGDNEPYDGALVGDTMYRHCMTKGIAHALIEVRQDLIADEAGIEAWADRLTPIFERLNADPTLHDYKIYASRTGPYRKTVEHTQ